LPSILFGNAGAGKCTSLPSSRVTLADVQDLKQGGYKKLAGITGLGKAGLGGVLGGLAGILARRNKNGRGNNKKI